MMYKMPTFKKVYTESYRSGFYHPISILILALITLTVALAIFANSGFFTNKNVPTPSQTPQASPKPSPKTSPTDETTNPDQIGANRKTYNHKELGITFKYPSNFYEAFNEMGELILVNKENNFTITIANGKGRLYTDLLKVSVNGNYIVGYTRTPNLTVNGIEALSFTHEYKSRSQGFFSYEAYFKKNNEYYGIVVDGLVENRQVLKTLFDQILSTFQFLN